MQQLIHSKTVGFKDLELTAAPEPLLQIFVSILPIPVLHLPHLAVAAGHALSEDTHCLCFLGWSLHSLCGLFSYTGRMRLLVSQ